MLIRSRVFSYITVKNKLLVFDHVEHPELTMQVPGGTIEIGELPEYAALREGKEETGLVDLEVRSFLGDFVVDIQSSGKNEKIHAWYFHLVASEDVPTKWRHFEEDPHDGKEKIEFELYWIDLVPRPVFGGIDGAMYDQLLKSAAC